MGDTGYCCESMEADLTQTCSEHPRRYQCPDSLVNYWAGSHTYGLMVHDGGTSIMEINFCPWCGANLKNFKIISD